MRKGISLKVKLISAFLLTALLVILLSFFNVQSIQEIRSSFSDLAEGHLPRLTNLQAMRITAVRLDKQTTSFEYGSADLEKQKNDILAGLEKLGGQEKDYQILLDKIDAAKAKELAALFSEVTIAKSKTVDAIFELIALKEQRAPADTLQLKQAALADAETKLEDALQIVIDHELTRVNEQNTYITSRVQQISLLAISASILTTLFAIIIGFTIAFSVARDVKRLSAGAARLSSGDFSSKITITSRDELGHLAESFNHMSDSLGESYLRLALEKERDQTLLESMSEGMIALDTESKITLINGVAVSILGLNKEAVVGLKFSDLVTLAAQDGKPLVPEDLPTSTLTTRIPITNVFSYAAKDQRKILLNISSNPIKVEDKIAGAIVIFRDVTKEKEVDRMKTEFISLASHQLRTPLSAIKWFSEMLLNGDAGELKPEQLDFTKNIADSTNRMVDLVNSLLNISRIESGRIIVDPKPTDLKELITGIVNDLKAKTEERQQTLVISVHSDLPKINLDPHLIGQVYLNLLTNAIKYTQKKGEISVLISKKGNDVISQVTDNGYGIPKAQQGRIFQKFFRAENVAKFETDGTGLGLYLIKAIVESSGGKIWFESAENKGTTFWFTIPLTGMKPKEGEVTLDA